MASENEQPALPSFISLAAPYPHPVRGQAVFSSTLDRPQRVKLVLTDMLGRRVRVIADGFFPAGDHEFGADLSGLPAGLYVAHLQGRRAISRNIIVQ